MVCGKDVIPSRDPSISSLKFVYKAVSGTNPTTTSHAVFSITTRGASLGSTNRLVSSRALERTLNHRCTPSIGGDTSTRHTRLSVATSTTPTRAARPSAPRTSPFEWHHSTRLVTSSRTHFKSSLYDRYSRRYEHRCTRSIRNRRSILHGRPSVHSTHLDRVNNTFAHPHARTHVLRVL